MFGIPRFEDTNLQPCDDAVPAASGGIERWLVDILFCSDATNSGGVDIADITQPKPIRLDLGQHSTDICNPAASATELPKQGAEPTFRGAF